MFWMDCPEWTGMKPLLPWRLLAEKSGLCGGICPGDRGGWNPYEDF